MNLEILKMLQQSISRNDTEQKSANTNTDKKLTEELPHLTTISLPCDYRALMAEKEAARSQEEIRAAITALPEDSLAFVSAISRSNAIIIRERFSQLDPNNDASRHLLCSELLQMRNALLFVDTILDSLARTDESKHARNEVRIALNRFIKGLHGKEDLKCFARLRDKAKDYIELLK